MFEDDDLPIEAEDVEAAMHPELWGHLRRLHDDFPFFARNCLSIVTKGKGIQRLHLNSAQEIIHAALERQIAERGLVRAIILKGRQQGASTYTEGRFFWKTIHNEGKNALVVCDKGDTTTAVFNMVRRFYDDCDSEIRPPVDSNTAQSLTFAEINSGYTVGTAGGKGTVGRGKTVHYLHGSEVAYWEHEEEIATGLLQAIPYEPGTEIILESTANGMKGLFHRKAMDALSGADDFELIFIPWFLQTEYARPVDKRVEFSADDRAYQDAHGLTDEQLTWRHFKIKELGSIPRFRREYPATISEAFQADVTGALWTRSQISACRKSKFEMPEVTRTVIGLDPATTNKLRSDETGIVVVQQAEDGHAYVLEDASGRMGTTEWVQKVADLYAKYDADLIAAETNQGGDLVIKAIEAVLPNAAIKGQHVKESKRARHDHVHATYQRGVVHHIGEFEKLEDTMCSWVPGLTKHSPDRLDALCLAVAELVLQDQDEFEFWIR